MGEAPRLDRLLDLLYCCLPEALPVAEARCEALEGPGRVDVRGVLAQDREDQFGDGVVAREPAPGSVSPRELFDGVDGCAGLVDFGFWVLDFGFRRLLMADS